MKQITVIKLLVMHCWSETIRVIYSRFEIAEFSLPIFIYLVRFNPSSPNIHIQILQTYLYTFPLRIS